MLSSSTIYFGDQEDNLQKPALNSCFVEPRQGSGKSVAMLLFDTICPLGVSSWVLVMVIYNDPDAVNGAHRLPAMLKRKHGWGFFVCKTNADAYSVFVRKLLRRSLMLQRASHIKSAVSMWSCESVIFCEHTAAIIGNHHKISVLDTLMRWDSSHEIFSSSHNMNEVYKATIIGLLLTGDFDKGRKLSISSW